MAVQPYSLAIELSQQDACVAAVNSNGTIFSDCFLARNRESDNVMPAIDGVLSEAQFAPQELQMIAIAIGPGSFTGLRIACSIAKMISFASNASIVSVENAVVASIDSGIKTGILNIISSVKQDTFWLSETQIKSGIWHVKESLLSVDSFLSKASRPSAVLCDRHLPREVEHYLVENKIPIHGSKLNIESLLIEATARFNRRVTVSPEELRPIYPREPEAVRKWNTSKNVP